MTTSLVSIDGVVHVELLRGAAAEPDAVPRLLVEVPHGADRRAHYEACRARLHGPLPDQLEHFFYVNTDVGAWQLGRWVAEAMVQRDPTLVVRLVRCLVPRTFIDTNRRPGHGGGDLTKGAMTPGLQPYVHDARDQALLTELHARYTAVVEAAFDEVCGAGGLAFVPHTYGPVSMAIERVDDDIVKNLHWAMAPERAATWPVRPEVDLIHTTAEGESLAPEGLVDALAARMEAEGIEVARDHTYYLHPASMGFLWCERHPGQVLTLEVRRDLLVADYTPFAEMTPTEAGLARFGAPIAASLADSLAARR